MNRLLPYAAVLLVVLAVSLARPPAASAESPVSVDSIVFARGVESREPVGAATEFDASVAQVFCWTRLSAEAPPAAVTHVWYKDGRRLLEVPLTANYSSGRYWSVKNVSPGGWTVEVVGSNGEVLGSGSFKVK